MRSAVPFILLALPMCAQAPPPASVTLRVTTTRGQPVVGAEVSLQRSVVARSDETGTARLEVRGRDGESFELYVNCPPPLRSPVRPVIVRRLDIQGGSAEHSAKCEETRRTLVVAVRAENGPDLPIIHLGREVGRTDRSGAAHIKIDADIRERIELTLSTAAMTKVHPQNPAAVYEPANHDEIQRFAVTFTSDPKKVPRKPVVTGPILFK